MSTTQPDPIGHQDGNLDEERDIFCCGEPIWPKGKHPYRTEFSMSCGWVIVDPYGRESTLGYANQRQALDVAKKMTYAYRQGICLENKTSLELLNDYLTCAAECLAWRELYGCYDALRPGEVDTTDEKGALNRAIVMAKPPPE